MADASTVVVFDNGSFSTRVGFGGDSSPKAIFPTVVGHPRSRGHMAMNAASGKASYVGDQAQAKRNILTLKYPVERGVVVNWDDMEKLYNYSFSDELQVASQEHPVLYAEPALRPEASRTKMLEIMFEKFGVPAFSISRQATLSLLASGQTTGLVVDCGEHCQIVPHENGLAITEAARGIDIGGNGITDGLMQFIASNGPVSFTTVAMRDAVRDIKQTLCYVALDYDKELQLATEDSSIERTYDLPDGQVVTIQQERFKAPETLFQPALLRLDSESLQTQIYDSIMSCDDGIRNSMYSNIRLFGGTSMFPGMAERVQKEIAYLAPATQDVNVAAPPEQKNSTWTGGSMLAALSTFRQMCATKEDYENEYIGKLAQRWP